MGYAPYRYHFEMRRPLADPIREAPLSAGLEVRAVTPEHHRPIWNADEESFRDHWDHAEPVEGDFERFFGDPDIDTSLWQIAWDGDQVAGLVINGIYPHENEQSGEKVGWLDSVATRRPWRGRGVAGALIARSLAVLRERGMEIAALGVDAENPTGALGLYESFGFRRVRSWTSSTASRSEAPDLPRREAAGPGARLRARSRQAMHDEQAAAALTRRRFLAWSAASAAAAVLAACDFSDPVPSSTSAVPGTASPPTPPPSPSATSGALANADRVPDRHPVAVGAGGRCSRPLSRRRTCRRPLGATASSASASSSRAAASAGSGPRTPRRIRGPRQGLERVDASGATFVPGMVDAHSHLTLPGGAHWLDRADDDPADLLEVAERNGRLLTSPGVRWARDVGAPYVDDPSSGGDRP